MEVYTLKTNMMNFPDDRITTLHVYFSYFRELNQTRGAHYFPF